MQLPLGSSEGSYCSNSTSYHPPLMFLLLVFRYKNGVAWGIKTGNEMAKADVIVGDPSYFSEEKSKRVGKVVRSICFLDHSIKGEA